MMKKYLIYGCFALGCIFVSDLTMKMAFAKPSFQNVSLKEIDAAQESRIAKIEASTITYDTTGWVNNYIRLESSHNVYIDNTTNETLGFQLIFFLCAEDMGCHREQKGINIPPHTVYNKAYRMSGEVIYAYSGNYVISAKTDIDGYWKHDHSDWKNIEVRK